MQSGSFWPRNFVSKPQGERAGVFLGMTRFPGPGLESGQAWSARAVWEGVRGAERGRPLWPWLACLQSQRLLGPGRWGRSLGGGGLRGVGGGAPGGPRPFWSPGVGLPRGDGAKLVPGAGGGCRQARAQSKPGSPRGQPGTVRMGCWVSRLILPPRTLAPGPPGLLPAHSGGGFEGLRGGWGLQKIKPAAGLARALSGSVGASGQTVRHPHPVGKTGSTALQLCHHSRAKKEQPALVSPGPCRWGPARPPL